MQREPIRCYSVSLSGSILQNYRVMSQSRYWCCYNPLILKHPEFYSLVLHGPIAWGEACIQHHSQDSEQLHDHKVPLTCSFIISPLRLMPGPWQQLIRSAYRLYFPLFKNAVVFKKDLRTNEVGRRERARQMERVTYIHTTICKRDGRWKFAVSLREIKPGLCDKLEGWGGEGDGRETQEGGDMCVPSVAEIKPIL